MTTWRALMRWLRDLLGLEHSDLRLRRRTVDRDYAEAVIEAARARAEAIVLGYDDRGDAR